MHLLLYVAIPEQWTITAGSQRSREGYIVMSSTKEGARARRNRTRAAITTAAALVAVAAFAGPASAAVHPQAAEPLSGFPLSYTDDRGTADTADDVVLGLCQDESGNCIEAPRP